MFIPFATLNDVGEGAILSLPRAQRSRVEWVIARSFGAAEFGS